MPDALLPAATEAAKKAVVDAALIRGYARSDLADVGIAAAAVLAAVAPLHEAEIARWRALVAGCDKAVEHVEARVAAARREGAVDVSRDLRTFLVDRLRPVSSDAPVVVEDEQDAADIVDRALADLIASRTPVPWDQPGADPMGDLRQAIRRETRHATADHRASDLSAAWVDDLLSAATTLAAMHKLGGATEAAKADAWQEMYDALARADEIEAGHA